MGLLGSIVQWGGTAVGAVTGQPEIAAAAQTVGQAINSAQSGGVQTGSYGPAPAGWPYVGGARGGDWNAAPAPGGIPVDMITALLSKLDSGDMSNLLTTYVAARPKAGPFWGSVVVPNPRLISIAAAGGDDYTRNDTEARLSNLLSSLAAKYGVGTIPTVTANSDSRIVTQIVNAAEKAFNAAKDAAVASATGSAVDAGMPAVQRNAARQVQDNLLLVGLAIAAGYIVAKL